MVPGLPLIGAGLPRHFPSLELSWLLRPLRLNRVNNVRKTQLLDDWIFRFIRANAPQNPTGYLAACRIAVEFIGSMDYNKI